MTVTKRVRNKFDRRTRYPHPPLNEATTTSFDRANIPTSRPSFGIDPLIESGYTIDDLDDEEDEDFDFEEELAHIEDTIDDDDDYEDYVVNIMEYWPSAVPNKLGGSQDGLSTSAESDDLRLSLLGLPLSLPYEVESLEEMDDRLDHIVCRIIECVKARHWGDGFHRWNGCLSLWQTMGYPMRKEIRIKLIFLYYELIFLPGLDTSIIALVCLQTVTLLSDGYQDTIYDFRLPWRPLYDAVYNELFPHPTKLARHTVNLAPTYLNVAEAAQHFFHPGDVDDMLETMLPKLDYNIDSILATQAFLVHFLPIAHCSRWLPLVFRLWSGLNTGLWDDQASDLVGQLAMTHIVPGRSDPHLINRIPRGTHNTEEEEEDNPSNRRRLRSHKSRLLEVEGRVIEDDDGLTYFDDNELLGAAEELSRPEWKGIRKDVGIFSDQEFEFLMSKCLRSLNVPVGGGIASSGSMAVTVADTKATRKVLDAKKGIDRTQSLAEAIVYSMSEDAPIASSASVAPTPGTSTPAKSTLARLQNGNGIMRNGSAESLAAAAQKGDHNRTYLGGSKALDHMQRLLLSCETFFHPSNSGNWSPFLTSFLSHLATNFVARWKAEEDPNNKTPMAWRLTPTIKREFVLALRPLALTAMFNKSMDAMAPAVSALKKLSIIEPDLILPATIERALPSLQGLEETLRTPAVTYALAILSQPLAAPQIWRSGGMYVADILALLLPGIDLNDPSKTGLACMAITNLADSIRMSDISEIDADNDAVPGDRAVRRKERPLVEDDPDEPAQMDGEELYQTDLDARVRQSTAAFRDWLPDFLHRVLLLFANLPEEGGKSGRAGGKTEAMTVMSVLHTCGCIFSILDDKLFDTALDQIADYCTSTCRANAVDLVGELVRNLAAANAEKVFARLFPIAKQRITAELAAGASSTRTTTTSIPVASDAALHWWSAIVCGMIHSGRTPLSKAEYREPFVELLRTMVQSTLTERGWVWTGKILEASVDCLLSLTYSELKAIDIDTSNSEDFKLNHTLYWGKMYRATEVKPSWRIPGPQDLEMAFSILAIADEGSTRLNELIEAKSLGDKVWHNEFCRALNCIEKVLRGSRHLIGEIEELKTGGLVAETHLPAEMQDLPKPFKGSMLLTNPDDPRYQHVAAFRSRVGETLHRAAELLRDAGDNSVEATRLLIATINTYLTCHGTRMKSFSANQANYNALVSSKKLFSGQRKHHRTIFLTAITLHALNRSSKLSYYRTRSALDDKLIKDMLEFCLSPFVRLRKAAQSSLDSICNGYRDTRVLCTSTLFDALKPGTDPDRMKGALYVLRYNTAVGIGRIPFDWQQIPVLVGLLLKCYHENKASVQSLVQKATIELLGFLREPNSHLTDCQVDKVNVAVDSLVGAIRYPPKQDLVDRLKRAGEILTAEQDEKYDQFVDLMIGLARNPQLNWRYHLSALRYLIQVLRRDRPTDPRIAKFFTEEMHNPHPKIRDYGVVGVTRIMYHVILQTLCKGDEDRLFLQEPLDPLDSKFRVSDAPAGFTEKYLAAFREPLPEDESQAMLQDRIDTGWLVWGKEIEVSRMPGWNERLYTTQDLSNEGVVIIRDAVTGPQFWQMIADQWHLEDTRSYPSATHIDFILALTQLYGLVVFECLKLIIENYLSEMERTKVYDRHKTRAMWEFIAGLIRGSEDWPGSERKIFWDWFTPRLPELFNNIRHDTTACWDISVEYVLNDRDPRRFKPLLDFCVQTGLSADFTTESAFDLTRRVQVVRSVIRCYTWRFNAWADDLAELYFKSFACPYAEVRRLVASILNAIDQYKFHPSYMVASALVNDVLSDPESKKDIMQIRRGHYRPQLEDRIREVVELRPERVPGPKAAMSKHDLTATTILSWLSCQFIDVHAPAAFPYIIDYLEFIFELRDTQDNTDLQTNAGRLLALVTSVTPDFTLIEPLMRKVISILEKSTSWKLKTYCMPVLSLLYYRNLSLLSETCKAAALEAVSNALKDPNQEVRESASSTLSGFLRCSQRAMIDVLNKRFTRIIQNNVLPKRRDAPGQVSAEYIDKIVELHGAVLGATALVEAFPYTVPKFIPKLLADVLAPRASDPAPISGTIRDCVASFKRTHERYQEKFTEDQLSAINYAQAGDSYYA